MAVADVRSQVGKRAIEVETLARDDADAHCTNLQLAQDLTHARAAQLIHRENNRERHSRERQRGEQQQWRGIYNRTCERRIKNAGQDYDQHRRQSKPNQRAE